ncbi:MAG: zinc-ribbon domain-containing protein [Candidatus Heimdallarchaeota archaeon]|nr:zinc-ribbon domain-containing protein [Candidatus Heimdallarchaeota archaeon]
MEVIPLPRKKYLTVLSVWMIFLFIGLSIVVIVEGINIGRNTKYFQSTYDTIEAGKFTVIKTTIKDSQKIYMYINTRAINYSSNDFAITMAIYSEEDFDNWQDSSPPVANDAKFYVKRSQISFSGLDLPEEDIYYLIFYNENSQDIEVYMSITFVAFGHIIATSILGFLLLIVILVFMIKMITTTIYRLKDKKTKEKKEKEHIKREQDKTTIHEYPLSEDQNQRKNAKAEEKLFFCPSCGAPISEKNSQYCVQCGSTVND